MANLRETKDRIQSVKSTQKITRAMKMVAAAKVKKAENAVKASRPFTLELFKTFIEIYNSIDDKKFEKINPKNPLLNFPVLLKERAIKTVGLVVVSSNKGLAGAYTANIVRYATKKIKKANEEGYKVKIFLLGQKAEAQIRNLSREMNFEIVKVYTGILDDKSVSSARILALDLAQQFVDGCIDKIQLITTRYINMMKYSVEDWVLLPVIKKESETMKSFFKHEFNKENNIEYKTFFDDKTSAFQLFEPNQKRLLQKIVPMYITNIIFQAIMEAQASELASRMTAMSAATNNAEEMINKLTVEYNKVRQEAITQEITEVISASLNK